MVVGKFHNVLQAALNSILLLDKAFISVEESSDPEVAAAITQAFVEHVPSFDYKQQVTLLNYEMTMCLAGKLSKQAASDRRCTLQSL